MNTAGILRLHCVANVTKLPILEDQEVLALGDFLETFYGPFREVVNYVNMCFEDANRIADFFSQSK